MTKEMQDKIEARKKETIKQSILACERYGHPTGDESLTCLIEDTFDSTATFICENYAVLDKALLESIMSDLVRAIDVYEWCGSEDGDGTLQPGDPTYVIEDVIAKLKAARGE